MSNPILDTHASGTSNTILVSHNWPPGTSNPVLNSHAASYPGGGSDTTPAAFTFTDQTGVALSALTTSAAVTITGIDAASTFTFTGSGEWQKYTAGAWGSWGSSGSGSCINNDQLQVRHNASGTNSTTVNSTITFTSGSVSDTFSSTTVAGSGELLFDDTFETGNLNRTVTTGATTASWITGDSVNVSAQTTQPQSGTYSCRARFAGTEPGLGDASDATAELRFDLGKLCTEVWITYGLYITAGFVYRDSTNNKFFRLWGATYGDQEKVGASWWGPTSGSNLCRINADWNTGPGMGEHGTDYAAAITTSDLGTWMTVKIQVKAATAIADGTLKIWKNGTLIINNTDSMDNYTSGEPHAYRYGYLLGWANSGFLAQTDLFIDNVKMGTTEAAIA